MEYEATSVSYCDAEESDWLDVSYTERKYINKRNKKRAQKPLKLAKGWKAAVVAVLCVAVLSAMLFIDGDFKTEVFQAVKTASTSIFNKQQATEKIIEIPCNLTLVNVEEGILTFNGGRAALSLTDGTVTQAQDGTVTVEVDQNTTVVYTQLTDVFVSVGEQISANGLLGKYDGEFSASILQKGEVVKQVVGSDTQLVWNV